MLDAPPALIDEDARARTWARCRDRLATLMSRERPDIVHLHGIDFPHYAPASGRTVATLHLPLDWYAAAALRPERADFWLHAVSHSQHARAPAGAKFRPPIANGVDLDLLRPSAGKHEYAFCLGRICPEKGAHHATEAAERAGIALLLAGQVYPYEAHQLYFERELAPRLGPRARFLGPVGGARKRRLLAGARCLLVPSLAPETSSLVAMEALACGTPVIAFPNGALPDLIDDGRTGFLVDDVQSMAEAISACRSLSAAHCREAAKRRFSQQAMVESYLALYEDLMRAFP
jgi:glycosyltransferase involved in cell wall biosynthesis